MPTNEKSQQTLEPVHVRAGQPSLPVRHPSNEPVNPGPAVPEKPAPGTAPAIEQKKPSSQAAKQPPESSNSSVVAAIIATVIIVLGISALAVLAYIKTKK
ncbi:MAG TPA: hypothetical protein VNG32_02730 [Candidatus Dormibacteraeota bacterium]|nr:hypothetical protein [Candidatus Dormibacteraeota bacterium]